MAASSLDAGDEQQLIAQLAGRARAGGLALTGLNAVDLAFDGRLAAAGSATATLSS
jgi:hypothetical protein